MFHVSISTAEVVARSPIKKGEEAQHFRVCQGEGQVCKSFKRYCDRSCARSVETCRNRSFENVHPGCRFGSATVVIRSGRTAVAAIALATWLATLLLALKLHQS